MLQRTHNCNGVNITNTSSICAFCYLTKRRTTLQSVQKVEHQAPHRGNRFTVKQREQERQRDKHTDRNNQEKRARENNETDRDKQQQSKRTRQDKRTTDC